jgi:hypothetical protein
MHWILSWHISKLLRVVKFDCLLLRRTHFCGPDVRDISAALHAELVVCCCLSEFLICLWKLFDGSTCSAVTAKWFTNSSYHRCRIQGCEPAELKGFLEGVKSWHDSFLHPTSDSTANQDLVFKMAAFVGNPRGCCRW